MAAHLQRCRPCDSDTGASFIPESALTRRAALPPAGRILHRRSYSAVAPIARASRSSSKQSSNSGLQSLFLSDISLIGQRTPLLLGFFNYFERHLPHVGFFEPIAHEALASSELKIDRHVELVYKVFNLKGDATRMTGVQDAEAARMIANGQHSELLDRIYANFVSYKEGHDLVLVEGPGPLMGGTELDAQIAATINAPVLMTMTGSPNCSVSDYYNRAMVKRQVFLDHKVEVLGLVMNGLPRNSHALMTAQLKARFNQSGLPFAGAIPQDPILKNVRLDEVQTALQAVRLYGDSLLTDVEFDDVVVGCQRLEELLEILGERPGGRPLVITSADRLDIVLGLLAAQLSVSGPGVAGVLLTQAGSSRSGRNYARDTIDRIFAGLVNSGLYKGSLLPRLFEQYVDANAVVAELQRIKPTRMTPKMFMHTLKTMCRENPQHIILPESDDKRVLAAAADVTTRGLAKITLLGDPTTITAEAAKLGLDLSQCNIHNPNTAGRFDAYAELLVELRKHKGMTPDRALDTLHGDMNFYATMMIAAGDADGMVSGACHTTASTVRPAMQVLKSADSPLVSSVFIMCLPDRVVVYGDCAVNVNPTAAELATIAITSADTAAAFGIEPRVAMLSYSTLGSGTGPDVLKVEEAVALAKARRPDLKIEGPIQYDAAIDPKVAAVKVTGGSEVAGKATVFVFPDLNTGNNTYKAVQQSSGAIAMGPIMQVPVWGGWPYLPWPGLLKPVNDLSRGCTVPDIVNTICVTSIQASRLRRGNRQSADSTPTQSMDGGPGPSNGNGNGNGNGSGVIPPQLAIV
ncbi:phosphate acetyltransferase [Volvox carteri f. nagariensis]|uniref:Phosphate acetyltransferase n=1 Tax=Volvox carteri f. nagariensis TaxID=3068 RepID=D8TQ82_VOLCA|nr:phosphate acetyltransferase [Volvox carteri f. nagariensis]EFJ50359.1 phosphate acetyltransferase [Volvox carteri f. nagariensis]|eukprot:XP_002948484.1 phosphate acetyltransferase [Volvox carteri f. nagariensis]